TVGAGDGRFTVEDLAEGTYVLQVMVPDRAPVSVSNLKVAPGATTDAGTIRTPRGGVVRGTVVDTAGSGIAGASGGVRGPGQDIASWSDMFVTLSEPGGSFEIRGIRPGKAGVQASHPSFAPAKTDTEVDPAKGPAEVRLVLMQGGRIEGSARKRDGT